MSMEVTEHAKGQNADQTKHALYLLGGAAIVIFGAGLILSTPFARRYLGDRAGDLLSAGIPKDIQRYLKMRAM